MLIINFFQKVHSFLLPYPEHETHDVTENKVYDIVK